MNKETATVRTARKPREVCFTKICSGCGIEIIPGTKYVDVRCAMIRSHFHIDCYKKPS